jgi:hypothetical protein
MIRAIAIWLLCVGQSFAAFTEFYCNDATGANINSGSTESGTCDDATIYWRDCTPAAGGAVITDDSQVFN